MDTILADLSVSITELKKNPTAVINEAAGEPVAILNNNKPTAYILPSKTYEAILDLIEDRQLGELALSRLGAERELAIEVDIDELI